MQEAAKSGQTDVVERTLGEGADIEARDESGETPLTAAALAGQVEVVTLLIERGADIGGRSKKGFTAFHAAAFGGHLDVVQLLLDEEAAIDDQENFVDATALHLAAQENHLEVAQLLLRKGAAVELLDNNNHTAASKAVFRLHEEMVILLRLHGAACQSEALMSLKYRLYCLGRG